MKRKLIYIYVLVFLLFAVNKGFINQYAGQESRDLRLIRIAEQQRVLCERFVSKVNLLRTAQDTEKLDRLEFTELEKLHQEWVDRHQALQERNGKLGLAGENSKEVFVLLLQLQPVFKNISQIIDQLPEHPENLSALHAELSQQSQSYHTLMQQVVDQFEAEAKMGLQEVKLAQNIDDGLSFVILILSAAGLLVFNRKKNSQTAASSLDSEGSGNPCKEEISSLLAHSPVVAFQCNREGELLNINDNIVRFTGLKPDQLLKNKWRNCLHSDDLKSLYTKWNQALLNEGAFNCEIRVRHVLSNDEVWMQLNVAPVLDAKGELVRFNGAMLDITDLKRSQEIIQNNEQKLWALFENTSDQVWSVDSNYRLLYCNSAVKKVIKSLTGEELYTGYDLKKNSHKYKHSERLLKLCEKALNGEHFKVEAEVVSKGGVSLIVEHYFHPIEENGQVRGFTAITRDISTYKSYERQLLEYKEDMEMLFENTSDNIISTNLQGRIIQCNQNFVSTIEEVRGNRLEKGDYITHDNLPVFLRSFWEECLGRVANGERFNKDLVINKGSHFRIFENNVQPIFKNDRVIGMTIFGREITGRKLAENELNRYHQGLKLLNQLSMESSLSTDQMIQKALQTVGQYLDMPVGFVTHFLPDRQIVCEYASNNSAEVKMYPGLTADLDSTFSKLIFETGKGLFVHDRKHALEVNSTTLHEYAMSSYVGVPLWVNSKLRGSVCFVSDQSRSEPFDEKSIELLKLLSRWIGTLMERQLHENTLISAKEKAEEASRAKADFLSNMSHEIRTPLNAILGTTHFLLQDKPQEHQIENLNLLKFSGENLLSLVNDVLDINKIESGNIVLEQIDFNLKNLLESSCKAFDMMGQEKQLRLKLQYEPDLNTWFKGDPTRLTQVINNLLSNALKFTHQGSVELGCFLKESQGEQALIRFEIKDTGVGIPPEKHQKIFERFTQANTTTSREFGGSGLGLSIVKNLLELMGSQIRLESEEGSGSVFSFDLPLQIVEEQMVQNSSGKNADYDFSDFSLHVLLAEDNEANQAIFKQFMKRWGIKLSVASNGVEALEMVQSKTFDMVFMDLQMPEMDGCEATRRIRALEDAYFRQLPIVALSASLEQEVIENATSTGMVDYISKPFNPDELNGLILRYYTLSPLQTKHSKQLPKVRLSESGQAESDQNKEQTAAQNHDNSRGAIDELTIEATEQAIRELAKEDDSFVAELSYLYRLNIEELQHKFAEAVHAREKEVARSISHKVKPTIEMLNLNRLSSAIEEIKSDLQSRYWKKARLKLPAFDEAAQQAVDVLESIHEKYKN